jgi:DNA repair and recombination RAD54-like protein
MGNPLLMFFIEIHMISTITTDITKNFTWPFSPMICNYPLSLLGKCYSRYRKSTERNSIFTPGVATYSSGLALPKVPSLGFGSASKEWENIRQRKVQLINFLSSLERNSENSVIAGKMAGDKLKDHSMEPTEQKGISDIIVLDSDDEDGNNSGYNKLVPKTNKQLTTSELASNVTKWVASNGMGQPSETMHAEGDKNTQIVPYGQSSALMNQFPLQTSWQPSIQFERVVLQKRPEEQRMQDLVVCKFQ